jgi:hypothetical protein
MNNLITVSELNDERYEVIDNLISENEVDDFCNAVESIQNILMKNNIDAKEQYEYLLTLMINQC